MGWVCEITLGGDAEKNASLVKRLSSESAARLAAFDGIASLDAYFPADEDPRDPHNRKEQPPLLILIADFDGEHALGKAMGNPALAELLNGVPPQTEITASGFRREFYSTGDGQAGRLAAPVSYVVRYVRPAADEELFIGEYVRTHPTTQARLPGIRSIMCYFPLHGLTVPGCPAVDYLIGNEVVFDSVDDFNAAMQSPAREELRAHYREFPPFSGSTSHVLMRRERLYET